MISPYRRTSLATTHFPYHGNSAYNANLFNFPNNNQAGLNFQNPSSSHDDDSSKSNNEEFHRRSSLPTGVLGPPDAEPPAPFAYVNSMHSLPGFAGSFRSAIPSESYSDASSVYTSMTDSSSALEPGSQSSEGTSDLAVNGLLSFQGSLTLQDPATINTTIAGKHILL
jgi:hypothetical protein